MVEIRALTQVTGDDLCRLIQGYDSDAKFAVTRVEEGNELRFTIRKVPLTQPYRKRFDHVNAEAIARYQQMTALGFCFGAFEGERCVGLALAEPSHWNRTLWVRELHSEAMHQRRGIGKKLLEAVCDKARSARFRIVVCETQNTNAPAIEFYRRVGFQLEGFDLSLYRNMDFPDGEIAFFMKRRLEP